MLETLDLDLLILQERYHRLIGLAEDIGTAQERERLVGLGQVLDRLKGQRAELRAEITDIELELRSRRAARQ